MANSVPHEADTAIREIPGAPCGLIRRRQGRISQDVIDLHCHILPHLDDGARDLEDSLAMARQAEADGITAICATPHIRHDHDVRIPELAPRVAELQAAIDDAGCAMRILPGGEVAATALDGLDDGELAAVSLGGGGRWILLEPGPGPLDARLEAASRHLRARGFRALIAHPERHLADDLAERLHALIGEGSLVQATAAYLLDARTRPGMLALARSGLIHVLGSDAHSSRTGRPVQLSGALAVLRSVAPGLQPGVPEAIVQGRDLQTAA